VAQVFDRKTKMQKRSRREVGVSIRDVETDLSGRLATVAALDSQRLPAGPWLVAEVDGTAVAVLSLPTGSFVADPFRRTVGLRALLEERAAAQERGSEQGRHLPLRGRGLLRALRA
jgi:hypothetical protein